MTQENHEQEIKNPVIKKEEGQEILQKVTPDKKEMKDQEPIDEKQKAYEQYRKKFESAKNKGKREIFNSLRAKGLPSFNSEDELIEWAAKAINTEDKEDKKIRPDQTPEQKQIVALARKNEKLQEQMNKLVEENQRKEKEFLDKQKANTLSDKLRKVLDHAKCNSIRLAMNDPELKNRVEIDDDNNILVKDKYGQPIGDEDTLIDLIEEYKQANPQIFLAISPKISSDKIDNKNKVIFNDAGNNGYTHPRTTAQLMPLAVKGMEDFLKKKNK